MSSPLNTPPPEPGHEATPPAPELAAPPGLSSAEARLRRAEYGANTVRETTTPFVQVVLAKLWAPVPWLLEASIVLQLVIGADVEAAVVAALLAFNVALSLAQERRASAALAVLRKQLEPTARVRRDGGWTRIPAGDLVPDDVIELPIGAVVPADVRVTNGAATVDQSMLTGESAPVDAPAGSTVHAGSIVKRGHALGIVTATGTRTYFGRTVELVRIAHAPSAEQHAVLAAVRNLGAVNGVVALVALGYARYLGFSSVELLRLALTMLLATVPVALPATFTLSAALSALSLSRQGALLTRLSAIHEAAAMDILCSDKTGTLTRNAAEVAGIAPQPGYTPGQLIHLAALTCEPAGDDPLDAAILRAAAARGDAPCADRTVRRVPFDPDTKMSQAFVQVAGEEPLHIVKGALQAVERIMACGPDVRAQADAFARDGRRIIAVGVERARGRCGVAGIIALSDPPRADAATLIASLRAMGVRTVMMTGDSAATAEAVARDVGLRPAPYPRNDGFDRRMLPQFDVFARVLPEDKYRLVQELQEDGHVVGMCGDGVNDAPALRQAQVGIAVSNAGDAAKAAAAIVLTEPGLAGVVAAVTEGRMAFRRLLTYTLNMLVKKIEIVLLLAYGLVALHRPVITPMIMIILLFTNDFLTMSLTTDRTEPAQVPQRWNMSRIVLAAALFGLCKLAFSASVIAFGAFGGRLAPPAILTLAFVAVAFGNQSTIYALRSRTHFWRAMPSRWLLLSSVVDIAIVCALALSGTLAGALPLAWIVGVAVAASGFALVIDQLKIAAGRWRYLD